jgi:hypothetical protein
MRVIGVGFGRTGTASLKAALERVGFGPCYHMFDVIDEPVRARAWLAAAEGRAPDWDAMFAGFASTVDWPAAAFWRDLVAAYPEAKVILTVRDPRRWYDSAAQTIFRAAGRSRSGPARIILWLVTVAQPPFRDFIAMTRAVMVDRVFDGRIDNRDYAIAVFDRHIADVRETVAANRLLVFDVAQGSAPLCAFLGTPVPAEPFPHVNDAAEFNQRRTERMRRMMLPAAATVLATVAAVGSSGIWVVRRARRRFSPATESGRD